MKNGLLTDPINYTLNTLMFDINGEVVFNEKKFMDLLEYALNNKMVIYGGGSCCSTVVIEYPEGKLKNHNL